MKKNVVLTIIGAAIATLLLLSGCKILDVNDPEDMGVKSVNFVLDNSDALIGKKVMVEGFIAYIDNSGATFTGQKITDISLIDSLDINECGERPGYDECIELLIFSEKELNLEVGNKVVVLCSVHHDDEIGIYYDFIEFVGYE